MHDTILDKATGATLGEVTLDDAASADRTIATADAAFRSGPWRYDANLRQVALAGWADELERHGDELAAIIRGETGKVRRECDREVAMAIDALRFNSGAARSVAGTAHELPDGSAGHLVRVPVGPAAFVTPWNWPLFLLLRDMAPALAAGVTAVIKPAPLTPLATARAIELAGGHVPAGVLNMVRGGADIGQLLSSDERLKVVAFTGSTQVGRDVARTVSGRLGRPFLELGGKGVSVLHDDADLDAAIDTILTFGFITAGQMCMANSRVLAHRSVADEVRDRLVDRVSRLVVGHPDDPAVDTGAIVSTTQAEKIRGYLEIARNDGTLLVGGEQPGGLDLPGEFITPALVAGDQIDTRLLKEEIFGPVVTLETFDSDADAVRMANDTDYGLAAAVWTNDLRRAWQSARALDFGTVWLNRYNRTFSEVPSGGMKASGVGRTRGFDGIHEFMELKHINFDVGHLAV
ncbi:aldehyde dehydrogenase family protein [Georgenia sp. Z1491]|uniref:aldehyde dehydrogenase family protein n=1 Tax=Georgenia sp. Z1491 TaxID=3416707 RepID=UPI003CFB171E